MGTNRITGYFPPLAETPLPVTAFMPCPFPVWSGSSTGYGSYAQEVYRLAAAQTTALLQPARTERVHFSMN